MPDSPLPLRKTQPDQPADYRWLERRFERLDCLNEAGEMLHWDQAVMMPEGSGTARGEQLAALAVTAHEMLVAGEIADRLAAAEETSARLDPWQRANLVEMRRAYRHATAVPVELVEARAKASQVGEAAWRRARAEDDFRAVLPSFREILRLTREAAAAKAEAFGVTPYEALVDAYEPGLGETRIDALFGRLAEALPPLLQRILERQRAAPPARPLAGPFPIAAQEALGRRLMALAGFDFERGRLDVSLHPFCGGTSDDVRVTTRYDSGDFTRSLMGVLHETGHALYEFGLPVAWRHQPVGEARGMALHESQSLLVEMQAARSPEFVAFLAPLAAAAFGRSGADWAPENLLRHYHRVEPSLIRVDADEVTYPLHIILRTRLERAMLDASLDPADLPGAWRAAMRELLGVAPPDDRLGCLQDIHWYDGAIGYFPTYTLGALSAAQLFAAAKAADPGIPGALGRGDFAPLLAWLRPNVHAKASSASSEEILQAASGKPLDPEVFLTHLETRYLGG